MRASLLFGIFLALAAVISAHGASARRSDPPLLLAKIELTRYEQVYQLDTLGIPLLEANQNWALAGLEEADVVRVRREGYRVSVLDRYTKDGNYFLVRTLPPEAEATLSRLGQVLFFDGRDALIESRDQVLTLASPRLMIKRMRTEPLNLHPLEWPIETPTTVDPLIQWLVAQVREDSVRSYIQRLQDFHTRYSFNDSCDAAARYLSDHFKACGLDSVYFHHYAGNYPDNVVATLPGIVNPRRIYLICGHFDSVAYPSPNDAPGADDNASGTACVLEAARVLAPMRFRYTLKFIPFSGEEQGLVGSSHYAADAAAAGDSILGVLNFDMVSYLDDSRWDLDIVYNSPSTELANFAYASAQTYVPSLIPIKTYDPSASYSDHASFWVEGYKALCDIEHEGTRPNPNYHTSRDLISTLSIPFATACATYGVATLAALGIPDTTEYVSIAVVPDTTIVHPGGTLGFEWTLVNNSADTRTVQVWSDVTLPNGHPYGRNPVLGPTVVTLAPHETTSSHFTQSVPLNAKAGTYTYCGKVGTHPAEMDESCFVLTVEP